MARKPAKPRRPKRSRPAASEQLAIIGEPTDGDLALQLEQLRAENVALRSRSEQLDAQLRQLTTDSASLRLKIDELTGQLARLDTQSRQLQLERDESRGTLEALRADQDRIIADATRNALQQAETRHSSELAQLIRERDELRAELTKLAERVPKSPDRPTIPGNLAESFARVLDQLGDGLPTTKSFTSALTALEVEARGVLQGPGRRQW